MRIKPQESLLLIVDLQEKLLPAINKNKEIIENAHWLVDVATLLEIPIITTEHLPEKVGFTEQTLRKKIEDSLILDKTHFSAVAEGNLINELKKQNRYQIIVIGTEAHVCVQQTVLDLLALDYEVFIVNEAIGSRKNQDKKLALNRMKDNGAEVVSREMVAFEWLEKAGTDIFRTILKEYIK